MGFLDKKKEEKGYDIGAGKSVKKLKRTGVMLDPDTIDFALEFSYKMQKEHNRKVPLSELLRCSVKLFASLPFAEQKDRLEG